MIDIEYVKTEIEFALGNLKRLFTDEVKLTLIARVPSDNGATMIVTADNLDDIIEAIRLTKVKGRDKNDST